MTLKPAKDSSIETLRGIALILMVAGHVIGSDPGNGLRIEAPHPMRYFYFMFEYLRMPLFTVISGYVYSLRPVSGQASLPSFFYGKAIRILIPFVVASTLIAFLQMSIPGTNSSIPLNDLWKIYIYGSFQFWFLQAIFLVFVIMGFLEVSGAVASARRWLLVTTICFVIYPFFAFEHNIFNVNKMLYLLPFFLLGYGFQKYGKDLFSLQKKYIVFPVFLIAFVFQQVVYFSGASSLTETQWDILSIVVGISGIYSLFFIRFTLSPLVYIGYYSYGVYLYHTLGTAGARIMLNRIGFQNEYFLFAMGLSAGIIFPIIFQKLVENIPVINTALFGIKPRPRSARVLEFKKGTEVPLSK